MLLDSRKAGAEKDTPAPDVLIAALARLLGVAGPKAPVAGMPAAG